MRKRLLNCEFISADGFKNNLSNRAKLLYFLMFASADDKGFVDTAQNIIEQLTDSEQKFDNSVSLQLIGNDYQTALSELVDKGFLYLFVGDHGQQVYLIRHWYMHNVELKKTWTNYLTYLKQVYLIGYKYIRKNEYKEYKENNSNNIDVHITKEQEEVNDSEWNDIVNGIDNAKPKGEENGKT